MLKRNPSGRHPHIIPIYPFDVEVFVCDEGFVESNIKRYVCLSEVAIPGMTWDRISTWGMEVNDLIGDSLGEAVVVEF
jgi:hypothetical protein